MKNFSNTIADTNERLVNLNEQIKTLHREMSINYTVILNSMFVPFLLQYPMVRSIHWTQYTPYFNDGETCEFGVGELSFSYEDDEDMTEEACIYSESDIAYYERQIVNIKEYEQKVKGDLVTNAFYSRPYYSEEDCNKYITTIKKFIADPATKNMARDWDTLSTSFGLFDEDVLHHSYGNHCQIVVTKEGTEVQEYEHD